MGPAIRLYMMKYDSYIPVYKQPGGKYRISISKFHILHNILIEKYHTDRLVL